MREPSIRELRAFAVLAEELHFRRAAMRLEMSQSALSEAIRRLEDAVDAVLLARTSRRVALTEAGEELLPRARDLLLRLDSLRSKPVEPPAPQGVLRVGVGANGLGELTRPIFTTFRSRQPDLQVRVRELFCSPAEFAEGAFDVALVRMPFDDERIELHPLAAEDRGVMVPARHRLADAEDAPIADVLDDVFVAYAGEPPIRDYWLGIAHRGGEPPRIGGYATTMVDWVDAVAYTGLVTLSGRSVMRSFPCHGIAMAGVADLRPNVHAVAVHRGDARPEVRGFVAVARAVVARLAPAVPHFSPLVMN